MVAGHTYQLHEDWYCSPNNIKVTISTISGAAMLVLKDF
jgi:hypothetical protein